jgi:hypothetical protein
MPVSSTAAGMKNYVPRRPGKVLNDVVTPEIRAKRAKMLNEARLDKEAQMGQQQYNKIQDESVAGMKKGGKVAKYARGGGIEQRGKTRGKMC